MPSSMIFVSLVVVWLLILVPAVARRQQQVARPSAAALSGRVLERPNQRRWSQEVAQMEQSEQRTVATRVDRPEDEVRVPEARDPEERSEDEDLPADADERRWERPPARYRPGRGGFDPEAAALAASARYAARQRVVIGLLVAVLISAGLALFVSNTLWWLTAVVGALLVGYLVYLRRQVRMEETIRDRRAARMAGTRRPSAAEDPELDEWARRGRDAARGDADLDDLDDVGEDPTADGWDDAEADTGLDGPGADRDEPEDDGEEHVDEIAAHVEDGDPSRVKGTGEPLGVLPAKRRTVHADDDDSDDDEIETALPRLEPAPTPPLPAGTTVVVLDEDDLELSELDQSVRPGYRRAAGQ